MKMRPFKREIREKKGIALIMALWIMTILLVVAASFAFMMRTEVKMAGNYRNGVKAHYLALAGVEHAIAALLNDTGNTDHYGEGWHTTFRTNWVPADVTWDALPIPYGGGTYAVHLSDENSKCDLSWSNASGLLFLMTPKVPGNDPTTWAAYCRKVCKVADYADEDSDVHTYPGQPTYAGYETGVKNKPFDTLREIQKVTGINESSSTGYGTDYDNPLDTVKTASWERGDDTDMTVYARDYNTQVGGSDREDILTCSAGDLQTATTGLTLAQCTEIVNDSATYSDYNYPWGQADVEDYIGIGAATEVTALNRAAIWEQDMVNNADVITVGDYGGDNIIQGAININTATFYGLMSILEIAQAKGQNIIDVRRGVKMAWQPTNEDGTTYTEEYLRNIHGVADDYFEHRGELLYVEGIARDTFQNFADVITVRSDRFRIYSTGKVGIDGNSDGDLEDSVDTVFAARKIEAVVDRHYHDTSPPTPGPIEVLYWSERVFED